MIAVRVRATSFTPRGPGRPRHAPAAWLTLAAAKRALWSVLRRTPSPLSPEEVAEGLAPVEAWVRGIPVVVSRGAGVAELARDGWNGFTCAPDDPEDLARGMIALAQDEAAARAMGARGRATAQACDVATAAGRVWDVLLQAGRAARGPQRRAAA